MEIETHTIEREADRQSEEDSGGNKQTLAAIVKRQNLRIASLTKDRQRKV